jgi:hypothetical protein
VTEFIVTERACMVCDYPFSDQHHPIPQRLVPIAVTVLLCPNHHRFADILLKMVLGGCEREVVEEWSRIYFDEQFCEEVLDTLLDFAEAARNVYGERDAEYRSDESGVTAVA